MNFQENFPNPEIPSNLAPVFTDMNNTKSVMLLVTWCNVDKGDGRNC